MVSAGVVEIEDLFVVSHWVKECPSAKGRTGLVTLLSLDGTGYLGTSPDGANAKCVHKQLNNLLAGFVGPGAPEFVVDEGQL